MLTDKKNWIKTEFFHEQKRLHFGQHKQNWNTNMVDGSDDEINENEHYVEDVHIPLMAYQNPPRKKQIKW